MRHIFLLWFLVSLIHNYGTSLSTKMSKTTPKSVKTLTTKLIKTTTESDQYVGEEEVADVESGSEESITSTSFKNGGGGHSSTHGYFDNPLFVNAPAIIVVADDLPVSSEIGKVAAIDPTSQQRKCFYQIIPYKNYPFSVDRETGVIRTTTRLDTGESGKMNITEYTLSICTAFHNFTAKKIMVENSTSSEILLEYTEEEDVVIHVKILPGPLRENIGAPGRVTTVWSTFWNGANSWIQLPTVIILVVFMVLLTTVTIVAMNRRRWKNKRNPPPPTCTHVAPGYPKI